MQFSISKIKAGETGHEHEVLVRLHGHGAENYIPASVEKALAVSLPEDWWVDNRGSRLEIRQFDNYGVYGSDEEQVVREACVQAGFDLNLK